MSAVASPYRELRWNTMLNYCIIIIWIIDWFSPFSGNLKKIFYFLSMFLSQFLGVLDIISVACVSVCLSLCLSLSLSLSLCVSLFLSLWVSVCVWLSLSLCVTVSVCMALWVCVELLERALLCFLLNLVYHNIDVGGSSLIGIPTPLLLNTSWRMNLLLKDGGYTYSGTPLL